MTPEPERGLQAERTILAHWRTSLAATVTALLVVRTADPGAERLVVVVAVAVLVAPVTAVGYRRRQALVAGRWRASPRTIVAVAAVIAALQVAAVVVVV